MDLDIKVSEVILVGNSTDSGDTAQKWLGIPGQNQRGAEEAYGSAIRRSVSLMMRFGRAMLGRGRPYPAQVVGVWGVRGSSLALDARSPSSGRDVDLRPPELLA